MNVTLKLKATDGSLVPQYMTQGSAGMDLKSAVDMVIDPMERQLVGTGLFMEIPLGYEGQIRPRSGLAIKYGIGVLNSPGTIDSDYRGEVKIILMNHSRNSFEIKKGDRIAQLVIAKVEQPVIEFVADVTTTKRANGGFGSTGIGSGPNNSVPKETL